MIDRYQTPAMAQIWGREAKYNRWLEVELAICEGWAEEGIIPPEDLQQIKENADCSATSTCPQCIPEFVCSPAGFSM